MATQTLFDAGTVAEKTVDGFVIFFQEGGRKNYITGQHTRSDNRYLIIHHVNAKQAKPFVTEHEAATYIANIFNCYDRKFSIEPAQLPASSFLLTKKLAKKERLA